MNSPTCPLATSTCSGVMVGDSTSRMSPEELQYSSHALMTLLRMEAPMGP